MIRLGNFNAIIDACVLYDSHLRDLLLRLAEKELYQPIWSNEICAEVKRNLAKRITEDKADKLITVINEAFPEAVIDNYSKLIRINEPNINEKDRHVLSAAICSNAQVIITCNLKDFPNDILGQYAIEAQHPDVFLSNLFYLSFKKVLKSYSEMESNLKNPPISRNELLDRFEARIPNFIELIKPHLASTITRIY